MGWASFLWLFRKVNILPKIGTGQEQTPDRIIAAKDRELADKDKKLADKDKTIEMLRKELAVLKRIVSDSSENKFLDLDKTDNDNDNDKRAAALEEGEFAPPRAQSKAEDFF